MDPNKKARDEFALARARKQFVDAVNSGAASVRDRFGRGLKEGDRVAYTAGLPLIAEVQSVGPDLRASVPPGAMKLVLMIPVELFVPANQPQVQMITVMERAATAAEAPRMTLADGPATATDTPVDDAPPVSDEEPNEPAADIITDPSA